MTELGDIFAELGISQYLQSFIDQGFDTWDTILDITESDFDALGVKLGHRRKLQRKIAQTRGLSSDTALRSPSRNTPSDEAQDQKQSSSKSEAKEVGSVPHGAKRKYRRHPKPDEDAPERPPSAYVIFSNKMREELKGRNLSFTEIAKLVGENWQNLSSAEKEPYEQQAFSAKERHNNELAEYKKTNEYKVYSQYLADFKARQSSQQQVSTSEATKRPKLEAHRSTASSGTASSGASIHGGDTSTGRTLVDTSASNTNQWHASESLSSPQLTGVKTPSVGLTGRQGSPTAISPTVLPGYRDSMLNGNYHTLAWRDRDDNSTLSRKLPRMSTSADARQSSFAAADTLQHPRTQAHGPPPPLPSSESTNGLSTGSSISTHSSLFYSPRTPLEPPLDRSLPIPTPYSQKSNGSFDSQHQLPPFRPTSSSPQMSILGPQQSPKGTIPNRACPYASLALCVAFPLADKF
ncbi:Nucleosome chromatin assembly factor group D 13 [Hyphodiscus hymeniophilus]|uniref:Nucleosome chromatin assembly factor group D 13 n=1 Tax=Hyphodiscus hymeniophilus TaxID=353542 RepID=A0A9P6VMD4_9HELO|nr:Nucleosome chromatin assembly factor group D 13 [Hyphodiscus hymeniophilus]